MLTSTVNSGYFWTYSVEVELLLRVSKSCLLISTAHVSRLLQLEIRQHGSLLITVSNGASLLKSAMGIERSNRLLTGMSMVCEQRVG